jgi:hypothetical protein
MTTRPGRIRNSSIRGAIIAAGPPATSAGGRRWVEEVGWGASDCGSFCCATTDTTHAAAITAPVIAATGQSAFRIMTSGKKARAGAGERRAI